MATSRPRPRKARPKRRARSIEDRVAVYVDSPLMTHRVRFKRQLFAKIQGNYGIYRTRVRLGSRGLDSGCTCPSEAKAAFERCAAGKKRARWLDAYRRLNRFRTSLPSLKVHDFSEQHRRQNWDMGEYEADLATLLRRGVGLAWNEKLGMLTIKGIGKYRRVHASEIFSDDDCGLILETRDFPQLLLYQDGEPTPVSDLMGRENHIFTVVSKTAVQEELDWRLPVFEAGPYLIAFDRALLLLERWRRAGERNRG